MASSYVCFAKAVEKQKFAKRIINKWFSKLVQKDDYLKSEKKELLKNLEELSNVPEESRKHG